MVESTIPREVEAFDDEHNNDEKHLPPVYLGVPHLLAEDQRFDFELAGWLAYQRD